MNALRAAAAGVLSVLASLWLSGCTSTGSAASTVRVHEDLITLPTYPAGDPEPNPMFYFGRQSQGAQGKVYPYPLYDTLTHEKVNKQYKMVTLENKYVRLGILPEIGGRLFEAVDKSNNYDFVYRQHVIKPALIGLIGAWMSGGIEWNIPHHHRATTFLPVQYAIEENKDGSKTVWVGELEVRQRMTWAVGYTLYPDRSYLEAKVRIINRTPVVNTMLCFANVAVNVNDDYQVIYPPSTQYVTYHSKTSFTSWPIATGRYNGANLDGVDVSWYKNHISSNSMFAWNYQDDFFAGYDHGKNAGTMSVADHNIVPGKKLWTWGNGPRGRMWDHILTDNDGPYEELMVGAYSDNQPDYSWLAPYEAKSFSMYWYPFRDIGGVKFANLEGGINLEVPGNANLPIGSTRTARLGICVTKDQPEIRVVLAAGDRLLLNEWVSITPGKPYIKEITLPPGIDEYALRASLLAPSRFFDGAFQELIAYQPVKYEKQPMPQVVTGPQPPAQIQTVEELYLIGQRAEQFNSPSVDPEAYWLEALRRDPGDIRTNTAVGIRRFKQMRFEEAESHFRIALERSTAKYTTPKDAEATYYLGLTLQAQGRDQEALSLLYKATWSEAWRSASYLSVAELTAKQGEYTRALDFASRSLDANALNIRAAILKSAMLRQIGNGYPNTDAVAVLTAISEKLDPIDPGPIAEMWWDQGQGKATEQKLAAMMSAFPTTAQECVMQYMRAGLWFDAIRVLQVAIEHAPDKDKINPLLYYDLAYCTRRDAEEQEKMRTSGLSMMRFSRVRENEESAQKYAQLAIAASPDYVFPFQYEQIPVLREAMTKNPTDARAPYYLGNLLFDGNPEEATRLWEISAQLDPSFAIVHRNLAIAYQHQHTPGSLQKAIAQLEQAVASGKKYPLHFAELDELYAAAGTPIEKRLALLESNHAIVARRDDSLAREVRLKIIAGKLDEAIALLKCKEYSIWENQSLGVAEAWQDAHILRAQNEITRREFQQALTDLAVAADIPPNLPGETRGAGRETQRHYLMGLACEGLKLPADAQREWIAATTILASPNSPSPRVLLNSSNEEQRFYQALAFQKLGQDSQAAALFQQLAQSAATDLQSAAPLDPTAPFEAQQPQRQRLAAAHLSAALAHLGQKQESQAREEFRAALTLTPDLIPARRALAESTGSQ